MDAFDLLELGLDLVLDLASGRVSVRRVLGTALVVVGVGLWLFTAGSTAAVGLGLAALGSLAWIAPALLRSLGRVLSRVVA